MEIRQRDKRNTLSSDKKDEQLCRLQALGALRRA